MLGSCLSESDSAPASLVDYERRRFARTARLVRLSHSAGRVAQTRNPLVRGARDAVSHRMSRERQLRGLAPVVRG